MQQIVTKLALHLELDRVKIRKIDFQCSSNSSFKTFFSFSSSFFFHIFRLQGMTNQLFAKLNYKITIISPPSSTSSKNNNDAGDDEAIEISNLSSSEVKEEVLAVGNSTQVFAPRIRLKDLYISRISSGGELHELYKA